MEPYNSAHEITELHPLLKKLDEIISSLVNALEDHSMYFEILQQCYRLVNPTYQWKKLAREGCADPEAMNDLASRYNESALTFLMAYHDWEPIQERLNQGEHELGETIAALALAESEETDIELKLVMQTQALSASQFHNQLSGKQRNFKISPEILNLAFQIQIDAFERLAREFESYAETSGYTRDCVTLRKRAGNQTASETRNIQAISFPSDWASEYPASAKLDETLKSTKTLLDRTNSCYLTLRNARKGLYQDDFCLHLVRAIHNFPKQSTESGVSIAALLKADEARFADFEQKRQLVELTAKKLDTGLKQLIESLREAIKESSALRSRRRNPEEEKSLRIMMHNCLAVDLALRYHYRLFDEINSACVYDSDYREGKEALNKTYEVVVKNNYSAQIERLKKARENEVSQTQETSEQPSEI